MLSYCSVETILRYAYKLRWSSSLFRYLWFLLDQKIIPVKTLVSVTTQFILQILRAKFAVKTFPQETSWWTLRLQILRAIFGNPNLTWFPLMNLDIVGILLLWRLHLESKIWKVANMNADHSCHKDHLFAALFDTASKSQSICTSYSLGFREASISNVGINAVSCALLSSSSQN